MIEELLFKTCSDARGWCEEHLALPAMVSHRPGPLSLARQPWMAEILQSFIDPGLEHLYLVMGSQTGKTTACMLGTALLHEFDPQPMIWAMPSGDIVRKFSKARLMPFWRENEVLSGAMSAEPLKGGVLDTGIMPVYFIGAREPAQTASVPAGYVVADEEAKFEHLRKHEAHPVLLLESRVKAFARHLIVHASTPNTEESLFWQGFLATDQRKFYHPCPHCGQWFTMEFSRDSLVWEHPESGVTEDVVRETAHYVCPHCHGDIWEADRMAMLERGEWRSTNPGAPAWRRGYHLSSLYSPDVTFGEFAATFWRASRADSSAEAYQDFVNSWAALPYVRYSVRVADEDVQARVGTLAKGVLPGDWHYIVVTYDPGQAATHWVATAVGTGGEMWVVDYGTIVSFATDPATGQQGIAWHFEHLRWGDVRPDFGLADSGDWTEQVYQECELTGGAVMPSKGSGAAGSWGRSMLKTHPLLDLYVYNDTALKRELYGKIIAEGELAELHLPADVGPEFIKGLSGQMLVRLPGGGQGWKKVADDHFGDCVKLARLSWWAHRGEIETE